MILLSIKYHIKENDVSGPPSVPLILVYARALITWLPDPKPPPNYLSKVHKGMRYSLVTTVVQHT